MTIADDSDVVLILENGSEKIYVRVSSITLSCTSPVFATMLGPYFQEGQDARSFAAPKEISLPKDDRSAMQALCEILHLKVPSKPEWDTQSSLECQDVFLLATVTDKYNCTSSTQLESEATLFRFVAIQQISGVDLLRLATAAYLIDKYRCFALLTRRLVMDRDGEPRLCTP